LKINTDKNKVPELMMPRFDIVDKTKIRAIASTIQDEDNKIFKAIEIACCPEGIAWAGKER